MTATKRDNGTSKGPRPASTLSDLEQRLASMEAEAPALLAAVQEMRRMVAELLEEIRSLPRKDKGVD